MSGARGLSLLSWNLHGLPFTLHWHRRCLTLAAYVRTLDPKPDLLLFSEVWLRPYWSALRQNLHPDFTPLPVINRFLIGPVGGLVAFLRRCSTWRLEEMRFEALQQSGPWWRLWEGDGLARKGIQTLCLRSSTRTVVVLHTHFQAQYGSRSYTEVRAAQWAQLNHCATALARFATVVCTVGDFNTKPEETIFLNQLEHWIDLTDPLRANGKAKSTTLENSQEWIDYILLWRPKASAIKTTRLHLATGMPHRGNISDHYGLLAHLEIR